ncbi:cytochrome c oxidase subunit II [Acuticoccus mangrovi]|uniref:Cytochrome c oxidase subunit 2 n=1 Tax=Acuticoccus mangrovi TaxID=2796142 RepID=A0A934IJK7_9HYPH|nr:cytochrome c oxidase subunit II [Acuticoccus mangrovi]MBJ3777678.1 cytochrome c oxidase subunit II [Acuticoccus mangrovi]
MTRALARGGLAAVTMLVGMVAGLTGALAAQPEPWGTSFQEAATDIMAQITWFEHYTLVIITVITLFVLALLVLVIVKFGAKRNPTPSTNAHNTMIEVVWTIVPVLVLVAIAFPSFRLLFSETTIPDPDITVKASAGQWYWNYEYTDEAQADLPKILSYMLDDDQRAERQQQYGLTDHEVPRLLAVDYPLVVPVNSVVHVLTTSTDVNHSFAVPAFGVKVDAIQGRLNDTWFEAKAPGVYYGQCSELCGRSHAFMPIEVHVLTQDRFDTWAGMAREDLDDATAQLLQWQAEDREQAVAALTNT